MKKQISFNTISIGDHTGYGNGSRLLMKALGDQGIDIRPESSVMLNFCMPPAYEASDITIGYTPWESTEVPRNWVFGLRGVDELWTCCTWNATVYERFRQEPIFVLPLGIEDCWTRSLHKRWDEPFTFLHVGEPAERKGGDMLLHAWWKHFRNRKDVKLIYKCIRYPGCRIKDRSGSIIGSPESIENIRTISNVMTQPELLKLYNSVDAMVYPTRGEGFGLIPFEAMASGLPTIFPDKGGTSDFVGFSPYLLTNSKWVESTEERIHPGLWLDHDIDELIALMEQVMLDYDAAAEWAYDSAYTIHANHTWDSIGKAAADRLAQYL